MISFLYRVKSKLSSRYKLNDYGELESFLGYEITRNLEKKEIYLKQSAYVEKILGRFASGLSNVVSQVPLSSTVDLHQLDASDPLAQIYNGCDYRAAVGSLLYLAGGTRPDLAHAVHMISQHCQSPRIKHWNAVVKIMKYLRGSVNIGLVLGGDISGGLTCYVDANHAGQLDCRYSEKLDLWVDGGKATTGYLFFLGKSPISWRSKKQTRYTATSSTEAEVIALVDATKEASFLSRLCEDMCRTYPKNKPVQIYEDNTSCLKIVTRGTLSERTKHFRVDYFYVTSEMEEGKVELSHCSTKNMLADMFTKALPRVDFTRFRNEFMSDV